MILLSIKCVDLGNFERYLPRLVKVHQNRNLLIV